MTIRSAPILVLIGICAAYSSVNAAGSISKYDLSPVCGYSVESSRPLAIQLHDCTIVYEDHANSPFFYGGMGSFEASEIPHTKLGFIKYSNRQFTSTRDNYYDAARDTRQTVLTRHRHSFPKNNKKDITIITRLEVEYLRERPNSLEINSVKERYDCWDGVAFGRVWAVQYSLCSLVAARSAVLFSDTSWQYQVIKSLNIK